MDFRPWIQGFTELHPALPGPGARTAGCRTVSKTATVWRQRYNDVARVKPDGQWMSSPWQGGPVTSLRSALALIVGSLLCVATAQGWAQTPEPEEQAALTIEVSPTRLTLGVGDTASLVATLSMPI